MNNHEKQPENRTALDLLVSCLFVITYADDGPNGICGQSCSITNPWKRVYLFETEEKMREVCRKIEADTSRKNSRVTGIFYPEPIANDVHFIAS